jgi:hypothetical protein
MAEALAYVGFGNFFVYGFIGAFLGGTALPGKTEGHHYYLQIRSSYHEVSQTVFEYSRVHGLISLASVVVGMIAISVLMWRHAGA